MLESGHCDGCAVSRQQSMLHSYLPEVEIIGTRRELRAEIRQRQPHVIVALAADGQRLRHGAHAAGQQPRREVAVEGDLHLRSADKASCCTHMAVNSAADTVVYCGAHAALCAHTE